MIGGEYKFIDPKGKVHTATIAVQQHRDGSVTLSKAVKDNLLSDENVPASLKELLTNQNPVIIMHDQVAFDEFEKDSA